jgi:hypothetical protein
VHATKNGRRGFAGELLIDDRPDERVEVRAFATRLESAWTNALDHGRENGIDALEMTD